MANNIEKFLSCLVAPANDVEQALQDLLLKRAIATAFGVQLDKIGEIIGQPRGGLSDDDYRRYLYARVATNRSSGVVDDLLRIVQTFLTGELVGQVVVQNEGTATVRVFAPQTVLTNVIAAALFTFLSQGASAGVRLVFEWIDSPPANVFTCDSGPGADIGHLAGSLG